MHLCYVNVVSIRVNTLFVIMTAFGLVGIIQQCAHSNIDGILLTLYVIWRRHIDSWLIRRMLPNFDHFLSPISTVMSALASFTVGVVTVSRPVACRFATTR